MSKVVYPYIPNSEPSVKEQMLKEIGINSVEDIYKEIPERLRFKGQMNIPEPYLSEYELRRHVEGLLKKNISCKDYLNFLGAGTWQHYVPAVCDTIISRDEFLTAYVGDAYGDHGKFQALFETASMIGEIVGMDMVNTPTYDWANAIAISCRMASRMTGRKEVLIVGSISPGRESVVRNYCKPDIAVEKIGFDPETGLMSLDDLKKKISKNTAAVYFENPSYLGFIESQGKEIAAIAHDAGAELIVGVDPSSLGILAPPAEYGADIICGEFQPFGIHMQYGGGLSGFIATRDEERYVAEYPSLLFGLTTTLKEGEYGFGEVFYERTSYASREKGKDFIGTCTALYGIAAGVYMALVGPEGLKELSEGIMQRAQYAISLLSEIKGVKVPVIKSPCFKEFVVNFDGTGKTVKEINRALLDRQIFGGKDISEEFPIYGQSALYCVTEIHTAEDIKKLAVALAEVVK
jgi:glycine dehydrogenase subunit 1